MNVRSSLKVIAGTAVPWNQKVNCLKQVHFFPMLQVPMSLTPATYFLTVVLFWLVSSKFGMRLETYAVI